MIRKLLASILAFTVIFNLIQAQTSSRNKDYIDVYPIRQGHKWGYIKVYPEYEGKYVTFIPPKYDYIGDVYLPWNNEKATTPTSPYKVFEFNQRVGLLDEGLDEIIPNKYKRIRPISERFFAVEIDSAFSLINLEEQVFLNGKVYDDIFLADVFPEKDLSYFFVKSRDKWGIQRLDGHVLFEPRYGVIKSAGRAGYYKVKGARKDRRWTLIDSTGQPVIEKAYNDIKVLDNDFIAVFSGDYWELYLPPKGTPFPIHPSNISPSKFDAVDRLNDSLVAIAPKASPQMIEAKKASVELWSIPQKKRLGRATLRSRSIGNFNPDLGKPDYVFNPWYRQLDDKYASLVNRQNGVDYFRIINNEGKLLVDTAFQGLVPSRKEGVYIVALNGKAGLLIPEVDTLPIVPCQYNLIRPFEGNIALCRQLGYYGVIGMCETGPTYAEIPCVHANLTVLSGNVVQVDLDSMIVNYVLNDTCGFERKIISLNGKVVSNSVNMQKREAEGLNPKAMPPYKPYQWEGQLIKFEPGLDSAAYLINRNGKYRVSIGKVPRNFLAYEPIDLLPGLTVSFHEKGNTTYTEFTKQVVLSKVTKIRLYNLENQAFVNDTEIIGIRDFDYRYSYTTYVDNQGRMGLIDRQGRLKKEDGQLLTYSYIGPFIAGRARVALNGQLTFDSRRDSGISTKFSLANRNTFLEEFHIQAVEKPGRRRGMNEMFVIPEPGDSVRWGFIDQMGNFLFEVDAHHLEDYNWKDSTALILKKNGKERLNRFDADYGLIDYEGKVVISPNFNAVETYHNYRLVTVDSTPTIYFTKEGHQIFTNRTRLRPFSEGLSHYMDADSLWGYVDPFGKVVIKPRFKVARPFSEGLAMVIDTSGLCSFIDKKGEIVFRTELTEKYWRLLGDFKDGRCWFRVKKGKTWGCYDRKGEIIIKPTFYAPLSVRKIRKDSLCPLPMDFHNGISIVLSSNDNKNRKIGFVDTLGNYVVEPQPLFSVLPFNEYRIAPFQKEEKGLWGLINQQGEIIIEPIYLAIDTFYDGMASVKLDKNKWGMINTKGEETIPARHVAIGKYQEGLVAVRRKFTEDWFFVDSSYQVKIRGPFFGVQDFKNGVTLITDRNNRNLLIHTNGDTLNMESGIPQFFAEGLVGVQDTSQKNSYFYADVQGRNVFGRFFQEILPYKNGIAGIRRKNSGGGRGEMRGAINQRGVLVVPPKFRDIHIQADGNVIINPQRFYGMISPKGKIVLEPIYDRIVEYAEHNLFRVEQGEKVGYLQIIEEEPIWIWELQY